MLFGLGIATDVLAQQAGHTIKCYRDGDPDTPEQGVAVEIHILEDGEWNILTGVTNANGIFSNSTVEPDAQADKWKAVVTDLDYDADGNETPYSVDVFYPDQGKSFSVVPEE